MQKTKSFEIVKHKARSSPEARAKARAELDALRCRQNEIKAASRDTREWTRELMAAARFAVDVNGDPPSLDQLRTAVEEAERQTRLGDEYVRNRSRIDILAADASYYQYSAGTNRGWCFVVAGQGDTKAEAIEKASGAKTP